MPVPESVPKNELLRALGRLTRGLSALFWGLPAALVTSAQAATGTWLGLPAILSHYAPVAAFGLILYGLSLAAGFQRQERIWMAAVERARLVALTNLGLSPFLFWYQRLPENPLFSTAAALLAAGGVLSLLSLNQVLRRLAAMLPDETLRLEAATFTTANSWILALLPALAGGWHLAIVHQSALPIAFRILLQFVEPARLLALLFLALLPLSVTMSLLWKTKEALLECVFSNPAALPESWTRTPPAVPSSPGPSYPAGPSPEPFDSQTAGSPDRPRL
jgi:hypothetical protein